jgi:hypothetical protein
MPHTFFFQVVSQSSHVVVWGRIQEMGYMHDRLESFNYVAPDLEYVMSWRTIECESLLSIVDGYPENW